jgi:hypothetical protein
MRYAASLRGERQPTPGLDPRIRALIDHRCMNPDPRQRATAAQLAAELRETAHQIRTQPFVHPSALPTSDVTRPAVGPPPVPPLASPPLPPEREPVRRPPEPWVDVTLPLAPTDVLSPEAAAYGAASPPMAPFGPPHQAPPFQAPAFQGPPHQGPQPFPPAPPDRSGFAPSPANRSVSRMRLSWPAVPIAIAVTAAAIGLASVLVNALPEGDDQLATRRAVYVVFCLAVLGGAGLVARRRLAITPPWAALAALATAITFVLASFTLFTR